jgi:hypothetical protein
MQMSQMRRKASPHSKPDVVTDVENVAEVLRKF